MAHSRKKQHLQPNAEKVIGPDHLLLADGQKQGIAQVVLLPAALHGLEQGKAQEKLSMAIG